MKRAKLFPLRVRLPEQLLLVVVVVVVAHLLRLQSHDWEDLDPARASETRRAEMIVTKGQNRPPRTLRSFRIMYADQPHWVPPSLLLVAMADSWTSNWVIVLGEVLSGPCIGL